MGAIHLTSFIITAHPDFLTNPLPFLPYPLTMCKLRRRAYDKEFSTSNYARSHSGTCDIVSIILTQPDNMHTLSAQGE